MSKMKTSGSKRNYVDNGSFADERNTKKYQNIEELPKYESIKKTTKFYNGKINYDLLVRFLNKQIGNDWNDIYSEIIDRIPTKLLDYKEMIFWFVANKVEYINNFPYNKKTNKYIWTSEQNNINRIFDNCIFYVCPITNKLVKVKK